MCIAIFFIDMIMLVQLFNKVLLSNKKTEFISSKKSNEIKQSRTYALMENTLMRLSNALIHLLDANKNKQTNKQYARKKDWSKKAWRFCVLQLLNARCKVW